MLGKGEKSSADAGGTGVTTDDIIKAEVSALNQLGYKQELKRGFSLFGIVAFSFSIVTSWTALAGVMIVGVQSGGPPVIVWSWVAICLLTLSVAYSMAEMASAYPVAGGQYCWVAIFAPKSLRRVMSYVTGWFLLIGILAMGATSHFVTANFFLGLANLNHPSFVIKRWHTVLVGWSIALCTLVFNVFFSRALNRVSQGLLILNISSFVIVVVAILSMNGNKNSASFVFGDFVNLTGFPPAYAAIVGLLQAAFGMCCYDSASRMTEEVKNARRQAPRAIVLAVYIGFFTGFIFLIAACFCMGDLDATAGTPTGVPIIEIFRHSTGSNAGATGLASLILMVGLGASNALTTTGGRSIYAFARDRGLPFSNWLSRVNPGNATPINGLCAAVFVQFVLLAIYFGAVQGFVTVISIATEGFYVSYALPLAARLLSLFTSTPHTHIASHYSLGRYSIPLNAIGLAFLAFTCVTFNFPSVAPVDEQNMNYTSAAVGVIMFIALITWLTTGRRQFTGPRSGGVVLERGGDVEVANAADDAVSDDAETKEGRDGGSGSSTGVSGEIGGMNGQQQAEGGGEVKGVKGAV